MADDAVMVSRHRVAEEICRLLTEKPPKHAVSISEPDDTASVGIDFGDRGYVLVRVEVAEEGRLP